MTERGYEASGPAGQAGAAEDQAGAEVPAALPAVPFGQWPSPITAAAVAAGQVRASSPTVLGDDTWWQQSLPEEGGRTTVIHSSGDQQNALLAAPWNARTRVHEYGGRSYLPIPRAALAATDGEAAAAADGYEILFANYADQRLYLTNPDDSGPVPLTPDPADAGPAALRYADFVLSPGRTEVWCVQERHEDGKVRRAIVAVPLDGSAADKAEAIRILADGFDFFAFPTPSPDGRSLAYICWNHPYMPWDGTELRVAPMEDGVAGKGRPIIGGQSVAT
jgi:hypothetical protein